MENNRPNILCLTYEDTSPQFVGCYGHTGVSTTPHMDALAREGVRFTNVFATAPVCSASRSSLITGISNEMTGRGHHRSKYPLPRGLIKGFPWYLKKAGYYTTNNAKTDYNIYDEDSFINETWHESSRSSHWRNRNTDWPECGKLLDNTRLECVSDTQFHDCFSVCTFRSIGRNGICVLFPTVNILPGNNMLCSSCWGKPPCRCCTGGPERVFLTLVTEVVNVSPPQ